MSDFDGGSAFPGSSVTHPISGRVTMGAPGLTKREVYAMAALVGILSEERWSPETASKKAFQYADAMLAESRKGYE